LRALPYLRHFLEPLPPDRPAQGLPRLLDRLGDARVAGVRVVGGVGPQELDRDLVRGGDEVHGAGGGGRDLGVRFIEDLPTLVAEREVAGEIEGGGHEIAVAAGRAEGVLVDAGDPRDRPPAPERPTVAEIRDLELGDPRPMWPVARVPLVVE